MPPITPTAAAEALAEIEHTEAQSRQLRRYWLSSRHLFLWGAIWVACYGLMATGLPAPARHLVWPAGILVGITGGILISRRDGAARPAGRAMAMAAVLAAFLFATYAVLPPGSANQAAAFPALVVALAYAAFGVLGAPRMLGLGLTIGALTLLGYFALPGLFLAWMAACGGGALLLGGVWLREA